MQHLDISKLKSAMIDAAILRAERTMQGDDVPVVVHSEYRAKWEYTLRVLRIREHRKKRNTRILAFIIAAAIMALAGCAWIYRERIADFWVTTFDKYSKLEPCVAEEEYPQTIETVYIPTYLPEGYELVYKEIDELKAHFVWKSSDSYLVFTQTVIPKNTNVLDSETGKYDVKEYSGLVVFHSFCQNEQIFTWLNEYKFRLGFTNEISDEEVKKIIENISKNEEKRNRFDFIN